MAYASSALPFVSQALKAATSVLVAPKHPLAFNVSHSGQRALIVIAHSSVGIDIECMTGHDRNYSGLIETIRAPDELERFDNAGIDELRASFFRLWTRKEAYCKAIGQGLYKAMDTFSIRITPHSSRCWVHDPSANEPSPWQLHDLPCDEGWMACVCTQLPHPHIVTQVFSPPD